MCTTVISIGEKGAIVTSRAVFKHIGTLLDSGIKGNSNIEQLAKYCIELLRPRSVYYIEEVYASCIENIQLFYVLYLL